MKKLIMIYLKKDKKIYIMQKIKGGQNFIKQNVPFKDNEGKFIGSYKRKII